MYPELYQKWFQLNLNPTELVLMEILMKIVGLLSKATLGHLADNLPLPILAATLQRFLDSPRFCKEKIWWGIWMEIMIGYWHKENPIVLLRLHGRGTRPQRTAILAIDRTSWRKYNLLVVSWIIQGRAIPINWQLLDKIGSSNLDDQQSVIHPITCLLPDYLLSQRTSRYAEQNQLLCSRFELLRSICRQDLRGACHPFRFDRRAERRR